MKNTRGIILTKFIVSILFFGMFVFDVFFSQNQSDILMACIILVGLLIAKLFSLKSRATFFWTIFCLLIFGYVLCISNIPAAAERLSIWIYVFLVIGIIQKFFEIRGNEKYKN